MGESELFEEWMYLYLIKNLHVKFFTLVSVLSYNTWSGNETRSWMSFLSYCADQYTEEPYLYCLTIRYYRIRTFTINKKLNYLLFISLLAVTLNSRWQAISVMYILIIWNTKIWNIYFVKLMINKFQHTQINTSMSKIACLILSLIPT